jgi:hypothetical protein
VGVIAYGRATDLTTDRAGVIRLLERYRARHERIEGLLDHWFSGLQLAFGSRENLKLAQVQIDAIFSEPGLPPTRKLAAAELPGKETSKRIGAVW